MRMNTLRPAPGSRTAARRLGRGIGSGLGKTSGRGVKGARARKGYSTKIGFEGGQTPLQRRLPKFGFTSRIGRDTAEVRLGELQKVAAAAIDLAALKQAGLVQKRMKRARIVLSGGIARAVSVSGVAVTRGARAAIEAAGGSVQG
jgi:large subunit ribosomal protein L15